MSDEHSKIVGKSRIERMTDKLYSRTKYRAPDDLREPMHEMEESAVSTEFESPKIDELLMAERRKPEQYPLIKKIFMVAILFSICAAGAAGIIYFKGDNFISTKNLDIAVEGPVNIAAGSPVDLSVTITNKNNAALESVVMNLVYPDGTREAVDTTKSLSFVRETVDSLGAGDKITKIERAVFFGTEGETKSVHINVSYKVQGSNALFKKDKSFDMVIGFAPVSVSVTRPGFVTSGESFDLTIDVSSNSEEVMKDVILRAEYPYGWNFKNATPVAFDNSKGIWLLGDLSPGNKKSIRLTGTLIGEDNEERTFRFFVGVGKNESAAFDTALSSNSIAVSIKRPSIDIAMKLNGDTSAEYVAPAGKQIQATITYKNNESTNLLNPQVSVKLSGTALDRLSVVPQGGFYNSSQSSIIWNQSNAENLDVLNPGDTGTVTFNFASLGNLPVGATNQEINLTATLTGRPQDSQSDVRVDDSHKVKIASAVSLGAASLYSRGPFANIGPIPPKAEQETTYTLRMTLGNTQNDIANGIIVGTLGPNVKWAGEVSPDGETVLYDKDSNKVTWNVGTLASGAGFSIVGKEVFFKVSITPSLGQVGGMPVLLSNIVFTGTDTFTSSVVKITSPALTTRISSDPKYVQGDETVVK